MASATAPVGKATLRRISQNDFEIVGLLLPAEFDSTTTTHGLLPILLGDTTKFLRSDGLWTSVSAGGSQGRPGVDGTAGAWTHQLVKAELLNI